MGRLVLYERAIGALIAAAPSLVGRTEAPT